MEITWIVKENEEGYLKYFLKRKNVSKRTLARVKFSGGELQVNKQLVRVNFEVKIGDQVVMKLPKEKANPALSLSPYDLKIIYEDEYILVVDKPAGVYSVPSPADRTDSMAGRVKNYLYKKKNTYTAIHVVTRLDRNTSGLMLFAKHGFIHGMMDTILKENELIKKYIAIIEGSLNKNYGKIELPIRRSEHSIIEREVGPGGRESLTEYWVKNRYTDYTIVQVLLHTGRTHQIRVHFSYIGHPLVGDDLYGGQLNRLDRQALHCSNLEFVHPISSERLVFTAPLPNDLENLIK